MRSHPRQRMRPLIAAEYAIIVLTVTGLLFASRPSAFGRHESVSQEHSPAGNPSKDRCEILAQYGAAWTEPEQWAWTEICDGRDADFNSHRRAESLNPEDPMLEILNPNNPAHAKRWPKAGRTLRPAFLETILLKDPFRNAIPPRGAWVFGAYFDGEIDLSDTSIQRPLRLDASYFHSSINMNRLTTPKFITFDESKFNRGLFMHSISVDGELSLRRAAFGIVHLQRAKIGGDISIDNSEFKEPLLLYSASIAGNLLIGKATFLDNVYLVRTEVGGDVRIWAAHFKKRAHLAGLSVGSNFDMRGTTLNGLDLTDANIGGKLTLGSLGDKRMEWKSYEEKGGEVVVPNLWLRNASVVALEDTIDAWPSDLELDGFTYKRLGSGDTVTPDKRGVSWFIEWLAKDKSYSPQPYQHLANVLRTTRFGGMADDILFANRERERSLFNPSQFKWWGLSALRFGIRYGYGLGYLRLLGWIVGLVAIGTFVLSVSGEHKGYSSIMPSFWDRVYYSLDMLLPVIRLRERHYTEVDLNRRARYYFYFHQIAGYLLVSILVGGVQTS